MEIVAFIAFWVGIYVGHVTTKCGKELDKEDLKLNKEENKMLLEKIKKYKENG